MKNFIISFLVLTLSLTLIGCNPEEVLDEKSESTLFIGSDKLKRKVIIKDSIYDTFPTEGKSVQSIPDQGGPQYLPNVDLSTPIIISKITYQR